MIRKSFVILSSMLLLTGCFPSKRILEDIQLVSAIGYDYKSKNKVQLNAMVSIPQSGEDVPPISQVFSGTTHTSKMARMFEQAESPKPFQMGRLEIAMYDNKLAKKGIFKLVDTLQRDPTIGRDLYLAIVDGSTRQLLDEHYQLSETPSKYLFLLLKQNMVSSIPKTNLHEFLYAYYGKGMDPHLPLLKKSGNRIRVEGTALLKEDRLKGKIDLRESFILKLMMQPFEKGIYEVELNENKYFTLQNLSSDVDYHFKNVKVSPRVTIHATVKGRVNEAPNVPLSKKSMVDHLEKVSERQLSNDMKKLTNKLQKWNVDPLQLGDRARSQTRNFDFERWEAFYPEIPMDIKVDVEIIQAGITE
jgi:spore germination protein